MGQCFTAANSSEIKTEKRTGPTQEELTVARLKDMRDQLRDRQKQLTMSEEKSEAEVRKYVAMNRKEQAAFALKRKKLFSSCKKEVDDKYIWTQRAILEVERALADKSLNEVMKQTNQLLRDVQKGIDMNQYAELSENMSDVDQRQREFNDLFDAYNVGQQDEIDKDLKKYEYEVLGDQFKKIDEANPTFKYETNSNSNQVNMKPKAVESEDPLMKRLAELN